MQFNLVNHTIKIKLIPVPITHCRQTFCSQNSEPGRSDAARGAESPGQGGRLGLGRGAGD